MNRQYYVLFSVVDGYVRGQHHCFVAECFLSSKSHAEWIICIRPTEDNNRDIDRYTREYLRLSLNDAAEIAMTNALSSVLMEKIDRDLRSITDRKA